MSCGHDAIKGAGAAVAGLSLGGVFPRRVARAAPATTPRHRNGPDRAGLEPISLGLAADIHQDVVPDGWARLRTFIDEMNEREVDAVMQLGDFAVPHAHNQPFLDLWNQFAGPRYHLLGNHDTDSGFPKAQTMAWWGMEERYYSFDLGGWHIVVLDGNDPNPGPWRGYARYINQDQRDWLAADLAATPAPTLVFCHQKLEADDGIANSGEVREVLENANRDAGWTKVSPPSAGTTTPTA